MNEQYYQRLDEMTEEQFNLYMAAAEKRLDEENLEIYKQMSSNPKETIDTEEELLKYQVASEIASLYRLRRIKRIPTFKELGIE